MQFGTVATRGTTTAAARTPDGWRALPAPDLSAHLAAGGALDGTAPLGHLLDDAEALGPLPHPGKSTTPELVRGNTAPNLLEL